MKALGIEINQQTFFKRGGHSQIWIDEIINRAPAIFLENNWKFMLVFHAQQEKIMWDKDIGYFGGSEWKQMAICLKKVVFFNFIVSVVEEMQIDSLSH